MPHIPQFAESFDVFTQAVPHFVVPPEQESEHVPPEQTRPAAQATPHVPQFAASFDRLMQLLTHFVVPPVHESAHAPAEQT
jgi:hypothetical protein